MSFRACSLAVASLAVLFLASGCGKGGPRLYPVSGVVKFKGETLDEGTVNFHSAKTGSKAVEIDSDGTFKLEGENGLEAGDYKVYITPPEEFTQPPQMGGPPMTPPKQYPKFPQRYREAVTTEFSEKIDGAKTGLVYDMKE